MFTTILFKELRGVFLSPKFIVTFSLCSVLMLLSVYVGIEHHRAAMEQFGASVQLNGENMHEATNWSSFAARSFRVPDPLEIFAAGVNNDIGKVSAINVSDPVKLKGSVYSDETIYALFRMIDFSFIVQIILSLFAVLFTYDAINGEKESGTLQLTFSNPVPRVSYILGKLLGGWIGLLLPLLIPVLLGVLLVMVMKVPMGFSDWLRFGVMLFVALCYFSFFVACGLLTSVLTKRSGVSFLLSLVLWVLFVLIIPRAGVMAAGQLVAVPSDAEIDGQRDAYAKDKWAHHMDVMTAHFAAREGVTRGMSVADRTAYNDAHEWEWIQQEDSLRKQMQSEIDEHSEKLGEELRNKKVRQEKLGFTLSRFSPASSFQLAMMQIAGTDVGVKSRYEDAMKQYRENFVAYVQKKQKETGQTGGFRITMDTQTGIKFTSPRDGTSLDYSDAPVFSPPKVSAADILTPVAGDCALLVLFTVLAFGGAMVRFLRYDLR